MTNKLAIIGGSGLYDVEEFKNREFLDISTPWGKPSDQILKTNFNKKEVFFLFESTKVSFLMGSIIPRQIPGKPDPVPRSITDPGIRCFCKTAQSKKCSAKSFFLKFLDTKFRVLFHFKIWFKYLSA